MEIEAFNITAVTEHFGKALIGNSDVDLIKYVIGFEDLSRLFAIFGIVFSFVEKDVSEKLSILRDLFNSDNENYVTVEKMVLFECYDLSNNSLEKVEPKNIGSRTLLRLHRALAFLIKFVDGIQRSDGSISNHFQSAYGDTLAKHHSWFIRQSVSLVSHTIPDKDRLLYAIFGPRGLEDKCYVNKLSDELINVLQQVYNRTQKIYEDRDILNLP